MMKTMKIHSNVVYGAKWTGLMLIVFASFINNIKYWNWLSDYCMECDCKGVKYD